MAGKGDKSRDYNRAIVKPHSPAWDTQYETIFKKEDSMLKTYAIEVRVPKVLVTVNAINTTEARKLALEKVQGNILGAWPRDADIDSVTTVPKNKIYDPEIYTQNTSRKTKDYVIRFTYGRQKR